MPQAYLGERKQTMIRPDPGLRARLEDGALTRGYGTRKTSRYIVDLLAALHPDSNRYAEAAESATTLVRALVHAACDMRTTSDQEPRPTNVRPGPELRVRIERGARQRNYRNLNPYLVDLLAALHPDPATHPEAAAAAVSVVDALLEAATRMTTSGAEPLQVTLDLNIPPVLARRAFEAA
ncbi:hypothetical protein GCM10023334_117660 [Nonomuraea thailandensis]